MNTEVLIRKELDKRHFKGAFDIIVKEYSERLYWHIRRMVGVHEDADDALQNTYIKIWKNLENFRGDSKLYTWLYRIATNEALSLIRSRKNLVVVGQDDNQEIALSGDIYFDSEAASAKLAMAVEALPEKQKVVFNLKYFEEMKYEEMSEILETSVGALKASYHHAVSKIREFLKTD